MGNSGGKEGKKAASDAETKKVPFKHWAKHNDTNVYRALLFQEKAEKRHAVYVSGKKCGDSEEALEEKIRNLGNEMVENFIAGNADEPMGGLEEEQRQAFVDSIDTGKLDAFDEVLKAVETYLEQEKTKAGDTVE
jgi:hypothetical protein